MISKYRIPLVLIAVLLTLGIAFLFNFPSSPSAAQELNKRDGTQTPYAMAGLFPGGGFRARLLDNSAYSDGGFFYASLLDIAGRYNPRLTSKTQGNGVSSPESESEKGPATSLASGAFTNKQLRERSMMAAKKPGILELLKGGGKGALMQGESPVPYSAQAVGFGETIPLSEIAKQPQIARKNGGVDNDAPENRIIRTFTEAAKAAASIKGGLKTDEALQTSINDPNAMPTPIQTFEGLGRTENINAGFGSLSPPDTNGFVGPNYYVQQTNLLVRVWNKSGTPLTNPFKLSSLFTVANGGPGGVCSTTDQGDPVVLYDQMADRWILSQFGFTGSGTTPPFHECVAISKTPDPTGAYYAYDFVTPGNEFPDYPKLGVWPDGYYMMVHQFTNGASFNGTGVYSFNRAKMLVGDPTATYIYFNLNLTNYPEGIGGSLPSSLDGLTPPPAGRPNTFAYFTSTEFGDPANGLRLFDFHSDFATPANSTFTEGPESTYNLPLSVAAFSTITPSGRSDVPQPTPTPTPAPTPTPQGLDAITDRLMHRMEYRNQGSYETLVLTHTVGAPASTTFGTFRAAPRYYELRRTGAGSFVVQEQATYAPGGAAPGDNISRWMASAAEDNQGDLALGCNVSSRAAGGNVYPGIRYAGRLAGDPAGGLQQG